MDKDLLKDFIWHRAKAVEGCDPDKRRKDMAGAWIEWDQYDSEDPYGWGIYPLVPLSKGGSMDWMALLPLHWQNARSRGDNFPLYETAISSVEDTNAKLIKHWDFLREL